MDAGAKVSGGSSSTSKEVLLCDMSESAAALFGDRAALDVVGWRTGIFCRCSSAMIWRNPTDSRTTRFVMFAITSMVGRYRSHRSPFFEIKLSLFVRFFVAVTLAGLAVEAYKLPLIVLKRIRPNSVAEEGFECIEVLAR